MWMLPLYLHVNQQSDYDDMMMMMIKNTFAKYFSIFILLLSIVSFIKKYTTAKHIVSFINKYSC